LSVQRVFISGASSGLGAALAAHYAAQGAQLGLLARRGARLPTTYPDAFCYSADVRDAEAMRTAGADFLARAGVPDLVIACAGVSVGTLSEDAADLAAFQTVLDINLVGMLHTFHPFIAAMRTRGSGCLAGIGSVAGVRGLAGGSAYSASKAAVRVYLESLRLEMRPAGIDVACIAPGYIDTPMTHVNPYAMPYRLAADQAARLAARAITQKRRHAVIPWQMAWVAVLLKWLPDPVYDRLFEKAPRKPRGLLQHPSGEN
jgi:short-subunit dehydrogenase